MRGGYAGWMEKFLIFQSSTTYLLTKRLLEGILLRKVNDECRVKMEIDVPTSVAYECYSDREAIPRWMPFISSVEVARTHLLLRCSCGPLSAQHQYCRKSFGDDDVGHQKCHT